VFVLVFVFVFVRVFVRVFVFVRVRDRARYHATARDSAIQCAAIFDLLRMQALVEPATADEAKSLMVRLVPMLTRMCR
jgi:hypothetical protein